MERLPTLTRQTKTRTFTATIGDQSVLFELKIKTDGVYFQNEVKAPYRGGPNRAKAPEPYYFDRVLTVSKITLGRFTVECMFKEHGHPQISYARAVASLKKQIECGRNKVVMKGGYFELLVKNGYLKKIGKGMYEIGSNDGKQINNQ